MRSRKQHPALSSDFELLETASPQQIALRWRCGEAEARLRIDFATLQHELFFSAVDGSDLSLQLA